MRVPEHHVGGFDLSKPVASAGSSCSPLAQGAKSGPGCRILRAPAVVFSKKTPSRWKKYGRPCGQQSFPLTSMAAGRPALLMGVLRKFWER